MSCGTQTASLVGSDEVMAEAQMICAAAFIEGGVQGGCDDACSICLENFGENNHASTTSCRHEYHLQCILEWSKRSKYCPMCWQPLCLKDPDSQSLLAASEQERVLRHQRFLPLSRYSGFHRQEQNQWQEFKEFVCAVIIAFLEWQGFIEPRDESSDEFEEDFLSDEFEEDFL